MYSKLLIKLSIAQNMHYRFSTYQVSLLVFIKLLTSLALLSFPSLPLISNSELSPNLIAQHHMFNITSNFAKYFCECFMLNLICLLPTNTASSCPFNFIIIIYGASPQPKVVRFVPRVVALGAKGKWQTRAAT